MLIGGTAVGSVDVEPVFTDVRFDGAWDQKTNALILLYAAADVG